MRLFIFVFILLISNQLLASSTRVYVFPTSLTPDFKKEVRGYIEDEIKKMEEGDEAIFISYPINKHCSFIAPTNNIRRNLKSYGRLFYKIGSDCKEILEILENLKRPNAAADDILNIPIVTNTIIDVLSDRESYDVVFFSTALYRSDKTSINFLNGYPSLGHNTKQSKYLSEFSLYNKYISKIDINVHLLHPRSDEERYFTQSDRGALYHESKIRYFWNDFFKTRNMTLKSFNTIEQGISRLGLSIDEDKDYEETKSSVFFVDLTAKQVKNSESGFIDKLVVNDISPHKTKNKYQYNLTRTGQLDSIYIKEYDGDSDNNGIRIKLVLIDVNGSTEEFYLVPSGDEEWKEHNVKVESNKRIFSIALYPVDKDDNADNFNGIWVLSDLTVTFK